MDDGQRVNTLGLLAKLRECLFAGRAEDCWEIVEKVETSLVFDVRYSAEERELVRRLRSGVSDVAAAQSENLANPDMGLATVPLTALETSLRKRPTGEDGWSRSD